MRDKIASIVRNSSLQVVFVMHEHIAVLRPVYLFAERFDAGDFAGALELFADGVFLLCRRGRLRRAKFPLCGVRQSSRPGSSRREGVIAA